MADRQRGDIAFGYDPRPFQEGMKKQLAAMGTLTKRVGEVAGQIVKKLVIVGVAIKGVQLLWRKFREGAPEISKAFNLASEVFFRNFFWPIRQAMLPLLQGMLDWVRDHRTAFVKWGQVVANIFQAAVAIAKAFIGALRAITDVIGPHFRAVFGQSFMETLNLALAKIAVVGVFVADVIKRLAGPIGGVVNDILDMARAVWDLVGGWFKANDQGNSFWTLVRALVQDVRLLADLIKTAFTAALAGLRDTLKNVMTPLTDIGNEIGRLLQAIKDLDEKTGAITGTFRVLGAVLGTAIMTTLFSLQDQILPIVQSFELLPNLISSIAAVVKGNFGQVAALKEERQKLLARFGEEWKSTLKSQAQYYTGTAFPGFMKGLESYHLPPEGRPDTYGTIGNGMLGTQTQAPSGPTTITINPTVMVTEGDAGIAGSRFVYGLYGELARIKANGGR